MPSGKHKSGRYRKIFVKTPGSRTTIHYREKKPQKAVCGGCGKQLAGVPRGKPAVLVNLPKTCKRPERPYGGVLCSGCARRLLQEKAREERK